MATFQVGEDQIVVEVSRTQLEYFVQADQRCQGLQMPDGVMLRYNLSERVYFYLKTRLHDGKIVTAIHASDSPYERLKCVIGEVFTPLFDHRTHQFDPDADRNHLEKVEGLLLSWVDFIKDESAASEEFRSFPVDPKLSVYGPGRGWGMGDGG